MASWRGEIDIPAPEVHRLTAVLPLVLERARALRVADGTLLDPWNGDSLLDLHVVEGAHPSVGTRYEGTYRSVGPDQGEPDQTGVDATAEEWPAEVAHEWVATLDADDAHAARVTILDGAGTADEISLTVELPMPTRPTEVRFVILLPISPDGFMAGAVQTDGTVSWEALAAPGDGVRRVATVQIGHPRFRAGIVVDADPTGAAWRASADGFVSGHGLSRPLFALMMFFVAKKMRPVLDHRFAELVEPIEQWNELCRTHPSDADLADALIDRWLDHVRRT